MFKNHRLLISILLSVSLCSCHSSEESKVTPSPKQTAATVAQMPKIPFKQSLEPVLYETPAGALATWRQSAAKRPALLLFASHPLLSALPSELESDVVRLVTKAPAEEIIRRGSTLASDTLFLPPQTVSAAISSGLFSEIVFVAPAREKKENLSAEKFVSRAVAAGFFTAKEGASFSLKEGEIRGIVRSVPFRIVHPTALPKFSGPIVLHIDLGFFKEMYVNEIKTPAYDLLYQVADRVREAGFSVIATTLSFSNQEDGISLESRFLIRDLADILRKPTLLDGDIPASWKHRAQSLYFKAMFSEDLARESTLKATQVAPNDPATLYAHALDLFKNGYSNQGFVALDQAVALDKGYAQEYLYLAEQGVSMGQRDKVIELLQKAAKAFPNDPFIRLELSAQLTAAGRVQEARPIIAELRTLEWSRTFHPQIPDALKQLAEIAAIDNIAPPPPVPAKGVAPRKPGEGMGGFNHMGMGMPGR